MADKPLSGDYGGGYLSVQRHPRNAVASFGFALVTTLLVVPAIAQSQLEGYKYPAKQVRHTQPQDGWLYTAANPGGPVFDPTVTVAPIGQSQLEGYQYPARTGRQTDAQDGWVYTSLSTFDPTVAVAPVEQSQSEGVRSPRRTIQQTAPQSVYNLQGPYGPAITIASDRPAKKSWRDQTPTQDGWLYTASTPVFDPTIAVAPVGQSQLTGYRYPIHTVRQTDPQDAWIYQNLPAADVWDESKFQNNSGEMTPIRAALKFRYPLASTGFSTDGSSPDAWDASKFQNVNWERTADRQQRDPRYEYHKFPFGLLDARVVMPAIDQLANSERVAKRKSVSECG